ncbi:MAG: sulfotransferase [Anaerolineae bacterium]|nr:sulfotransferase [Anaerolineae bacterium]
MLNQDVVVINAFTRGGSNILWNILQSHPDICSPIYETGQVLYPFKGAWIIGDILRPIYASEAICKHLLIKLIGPWIDRRLYTFKLKNLNNEDNRYRYENVPYTKAQLETTTLCLKSIDQDIKLNRLLSTIYEKIAFIGLVRNGYALCEGWMRRGLSAKSAGILYQSVVDKLLEDKNYYLRHLILRFEDILTNPFGTAHLLYKFLKLDPVQLNKLRLKSKRIINNTGDHKAAFGEENKKYWFNQSEIEKVLISDISKTQANRLSEHDRRQFEAYAKSALQYFNYG